jgi:hypothetical protein
MISLAEQIAEVQRELALRKACYPAWGDVSNELTY